MFFCRCMKNILSRRKVIPLTCTVRTIFPAMIRLFAQNSTLITGSRTSIRTIFLQMRFTTDTRIRIIPCGGLLWSGRINFTVPEKRMAPTIWICSPNPWNSSKQNASAVNIWEFTPSKKCFTKTRSRKIRIRLRDIIWYRLPLPIIIPTSISCWATVPAICGSFQRTPGIRKKL